MVGLTKPSQKKSRAGKLRLTRWALGMVETDMSGTLDETYRAKIMEQIPLGRFAEAEESRPHRMLHFV